MESLADSLPTDLAMKNLVDAEKILNKYHQCQVCENVAATAMCLQCCDFFCQACTRAHNKSSLSKHHAVETLASLTAEKLSARRWEEPCSVHMDRMSEVFCPSHGTSICLLCATTDHRDCKNVTSLETKMADAVKMLGEVEKSLNEDVAKLE